MTEGQEKIVTCLKGRIIDYVVDAKKKTLLDSYIFSLSEETGSLPYSGRVSSWILFSLPVCGSLCYGYRF